jgi:hypothetical protein
MTAYGSALFEDGEFEKNFSLTYALLLICVDC